MNAAIFSAINGLTGKYVILDGLGFFLAEYLPYIMAGAAIGLGLKNLSFRPVKEYWIAVISTVLLSRFVLTELIRLIMPVARPPMEIRLSEYFSQVSPAFPSGHAATFFALAFAVYPFNKKLGTFLMVGSVMMGIGRVYVGVHWPADIIGGAVVSLVSFYLINAAIRYIK